LTPLVELSVYAIYVQVWGAKLARALRECAWGKNGFLKVAVFPGYRKYELTQSHKATDPPVLGTGFMAGVLRSISELPELSTGDARSRAQGDHIREEIQDQHAGRVDW